ncbi:hypothetical protein F5Y10DRAFT_291012 [Nemania abortiva]|nr:hypothetical protein F5Y10DRAFT_291012 [Nemania abortiva]
MIAFGSDERSPSPFAKGDETETIMSQRERGFLSNRTCVIHIILLILQAALFITNTTIYYSVTTSGSKGINRDINDNLRQEAFSPAQSALQYVVKKAGPSSQSNSFAGNPRPEVDQAWSHLLRSSMIRVSEDELIRMNKTSIALKDGSGYLGYLESIHMLHCVKRIYQSQHPEHYPEFRGTETFSADHWDHCLDVLRRGIMCNADVTINTYFWESPDEIKGKSSGRRRCTDWDRIQAWADDRTISFADHESLLSSLVPSNAN